MGTPTPTRANTVGMRNVNCRYYTKCLDKAVECNWNWWSCHNCKYRHDQETPEVINIAALYRFLVEIFPNKREEIIKQLKVKAA